MAERGTRRPAGRVVGLGVAAAIVGIVAWQRVSSNSTLAVTAGQRQVSTDVVSSGPVRQLEDRPVELRGETMGTTYSVKLGGTASATERDALRQDVAAAVEAVDASMSSYRSDSELSQLNAAGAGDVLSVSSALHAVLSLSQRVAEESGGAFDITVAPLVDAYGFGPGERTDDPVQLARRRALVGYQKLSLLPGAKVRKDVDGLACTLSAVAKGYAVDRVAELLERRGVESYMVEIGGEVRVLGRKHDGSRWRVGIERPAAEAMSAPQVHRAVELERGALATSGDYRNYREVGGQRVSHTLDPRTGRPIAHTLAAVSVVHPQAADADAYATALDVLGPEHGPILAEKLGLAALFLVRQGDTFVESMTPAFAALVEDN